jgi:hypothetical protein
MYIIPKRLFVRKIKADNWTYVYHTKENVRQKTYLVWITSGYVVKLLKFKISTFNKYDNDLYMYTLSKKSESCRRRDSVFSL